MGFVERRQDAVDERGRHTLKVMKGTIVGAHGRDVFVELGPRMQGVIGRDAFSGFSRDAPLYARGAHTRRRFAVRPRRRD